MVHNSCFPDDPWNLFNILKSLWHTKKKEMIETYKKFKNSKGEKWPYWLGDNPDVGVSDVGHLLFRSRTDKTKIWNTFDEVAQCIE